MVAKPEYSSPLDEVCCWQGRRGTAASRSAAAELLAGSAMAKRMAALWQRAVRKMLLARDTVAEGHREAFAGRGAVAESHREDVAGRGAAVTEPQGLAADAKMPL